MKLNLINEKEIENLKEAEQEIRAYLVITGFFAGFIAGGLTVISLYLIK